MNKRMVNVAAGHIINGATLAQLVALSVEGDEKNKARNDLAAWAEDQPLEIIRAAMSLRDAAINRAIAVVMRAPLDVVETMRAEE